MYKSPLFLGIVFPALMVLAGWWAYRAGHLNESWFLYSAVMPALVCALGWFAVVLNEVGMRRERRRENGSLRDPERPLDHQALSAYLLDGSNQPDNSRSDRLTDTIEIINLVLPWVGSTARAVVWYRTRPLPGLDGQTAEQLVNEGRADAVKAQLARVPPADLL
jgi:hypothetical protein